MTIDNRSLDKRLDALDSASQEVDSASKSIDPVALPAQEAESFTPYTTSSELTQDETSPIALEKQDSVFTGETTDVAMNLKGIGSKVLKKVVPEFMQDTNSNIVDKVSKPIISPGKEIDQLKTFTVIPEAPANKVESVIKNAEKTYVPNQPKNVASKIANDITDEAQLLEYKNSVATAYDLGKYKKMSYNDAVADLTQPKVYVKKDDLTIKEFKTQKEADTWVNSQTDKTGLNTVTEQVYDENFISRLMDRKIVTEANPDELAKLPYLMRDISERNESILKKYMAAKQTDPNGVETMDLLTQFRIGLALEGNLTKAATGRIRDVSRSLGILNVAYKKAQTSPERAKLLQQILDEAGGIDNIDDLGTKYLALDSRGARSSLAEKTLLGSAKDVWYSTWINGLLSSPVTHAKNITGNFLFGVYQPVERLTASILGTGRTALGIGSPEHIQINEVQAQIVGMVTGINDSLRLAKKAWKTNMPTDQATKLEYGRVGRDDFDLNFGDTTFGKSFSDSVKYYGQAVTIPGRALMTEDEFFKAWAYRMELPALVQREGNIKFEKLLAQGVDEKLAKKEVTSYMADLYQNPTDEIHQAALKQGKVVTFTEELENGSLADRFNKLANTEIAGFPYLKLFFPFIRTPANIIKQTLERSPTELIYPKSAFWKAIKNGGIEADQAMAKVTLGSAAMFGMYKYTLGGNATGSGAMNYKDLETLKATGWQPFSWVLDKKNITPELLQQFQEITKVSIGPDKIYISYESLGPLASLIGMSASSAEYAMLNPEDEGLLDLTMAGAVGMYDYIKDLSMMQGLSDLHDAWAVKDGEVPSRLYQILKNVTKKGTEFVVGGSPAGAYSSLSATWERYSSPEKSNTMPSKMTDKGAVASNKTLESLWDEGSSIHDGFFEALAKYKSRNPLTSDTLPPLLDPLTGQVKHVGNGNFYETFSPFKRSDGKYVEGYATLIEYNIRPHIPEKSKDGVKLSASQYNRWIELATDNGSLEERVVKLGSMYKKVKGIDTESAQLAIKKEISDAYSDAWLQLQDEDVDLQMAVQDYKDKRQREGR